MKILEDPSVKNHPSIAPAWLRPLTSSLDSKNDKDKKHMKKLCHMVSHLLEVYVDPAVDWRFLLEHAISALLGIELCPPPKCTHNLAPET